MNILLWVLQIFLGVYFILTSLVHFILPPNLPAPMQWMYDLPSVLHYISGTAELLGGLGLILPAVARIQTRLVPLAASGLILVMLGAAIYQLQNGGYQNIIQILILAGTLAFVAYGRWRLVPLTDRSTQEEA